MTKVSSLEKYIVEIDKITEVMQLHTSTTTHPWFRGQSNFLWDLVPNIYRSNGDNFYERELIRDFKLHSTQYVSILPNDELEWLFIMQHYSMPTRLLDWTESYLIALYFAVLDYKLLDDAMVWILDPWILNEAVINQTSIPTTGHPLLKNYILHNDHLSFDRQCQAKFPVAIRPIRTTRRIVAQKGTFTLHGSDASGLNKICEKKFKIYDDKVILEGIKIDGKSKLHILKQLCCAGITHSVLFPGIEGLGKELKFKYSNEYIGINGHIHSGF